MNKDYYNFMKWNDLTIKQRAEVINLAVKNGIKDLDSIKSFYNDHTYEVGGFTQASGGYSHIYDGTTEDNQQMNRPRFLDDVTYLPAEEYEFGVVADKPGKPKNKQFGQRVYAARRSRLTPEQWQEYWGNQGAGYVNAARDKVAPYFLAGAGLAAAPAILANPIINTLALAYGAAEAPRNIREGIDNFKQGNYWSGIGDFGTAGLGILGGGILGYKGLQAANSIAEARIPAYGLYREIGRTIPRTTPTLNSFYSSDLTGSGFVENVYTGSPLYEFGQTMRTSPEKAYFMRAPKDIDVLKLGNGKFRHEVVGNKILPSGEINGKFVSYGEPWQEFALDKNSALYEFPIGSRRGPGLMATDWKGRLQKYSVDEVYDYMQRKGALNREFRKDVLKLGLDKLKGAERVKAYRTLKKEKYPELLEYYDTSIHGANQTVIPNERWNFDKFLKTPFWKYSENPISGQVQKELIMKWSEVKPLETPTISWTDAAKTPTITPKNAALVSPEQWTAAQDAAIAKALNITPKEAASLTREQIEAAVAKGVDLSEAQRLRDLHFMTYAPNTKAVDAAGYPLPLYHGTGTKFNYFDDNKIGSNYLDLGFYGRGHYFTPQKEAAEGYASVFDTPMMYKVYGNFKNPKLVNLEDESMMGQYIKNNDSVIAGLDDLDYSEYVAKTGSQVKSADAVTYDDNGTRIPLGLRDNFKLNDIRYGIIPSLGIGTAATLYNNFDTRHLENQYKAYGGPLVEDFYAYGGPMGTYYDGWGDIRNWLITKAKRRK